MIRVRFAPSPTGLLHIGGARTALFNWLFAKKNNGTFILRIEDTDRTRFSPEAVDDLVASLKWLGLDWDEGIEKGGEFGPYVQSERVELYKKYAEQLVSEGKAYKCFCTAERLKEMREQRRQEGKSGYDGKCRNLSESARAELEKSGAPFVIRFAMPNEGATKFSDAIRGEIVYPNEGQDDFVILKSDGFPTYHLANVVDDHLMEISHVLRGEEWIPSTPKHICLYESFGWQPPVFAHLPVILAPGGGKLSKRHGAAAVAEYREMGYLPEALVNFLALLGGSVSTDNEVVPLQQLIDDFDLKKVSMNGAQFDREKLDWMNGVYIRELPLDELVARVKPIMKAGGIIDETTSDEKIKTVVALLQPRMKKLTEVVDSAKYFFVDEIEYEEKPVRKFVAKPDVKENLIELREKIAEVPEENFTPEVLEKVVADYLEESEQPMKKVVHPLRVAVTGRSASPGMFETLAAIGKEKVLKRIDYTIENLAGIE